MSDVAGEHGPVNVARPQGMNRLARLPWRRIILVVLAILIISGVCLGAYKTFTLPQDQRYTAATWKDFIVLGVAQGGIYALIALGYTLVYGVLRMINFAHGEVFMFGAFGAYFFAAAFDRSGMLNADPILALLILFAVAMAVSCGVAILLERVAYRPLRTAPRLVPLIAAIGASLFLQNTAFGFFGPEARAFPAPDFLGGTQTWTLLGVTMTRIQVVVIFTAIAAVTLLSVFVSRTKSGRSIRAVAQDRETAALMGINVDRTIMLTFALGGLLAGIAAVQFGLTFGQVNPFMGFVPGIAAFTASVLGGIGSIAGAAIGGLILGLLESVGPPLLLTGYKVPSLFQLRPVITFSVLVIVLIFRPGGILGSDDPEKV